MNEQKTSTPRAPRAKRISEELNRCYEYFATGEDGLYSAKDEESLRASLRRYDEVKASLASASSEIVKADDPSLRGSLSRWRDDAPGGLALELGPVRPVGLDVGAPFGWMITGRLTPPGIFSQERKEFVGIAASYTSSPLVRAGRLGFGMIVDEPLKSIGNEIITQRIAFSVGPILDEIMEEPAKWGLYAEAATGFELRIHPRVRLTLLASGGIMFDGFVRAYRGEYGFPLGATVFF